MSTLKEFMESEKAVEKIRKIETDAGPPELEPDPTRDNGAAKEKRTEKETSTGVKPKNPKVIRPSHATNQKSEPVTSGGEQLEICVKTVVCNHCQDEEHIACYCRAKEPQ